MTDQPTDQRRDPAWIEAATDDHDDAAFYEDLNRRYAFYTGPLSFQQYVDRADAERTAIEQGLDGPLPYDDLIEVYENADDATSSDGDEADWCA